jgi:hypothetical protein
MHSCEFGAEQVILVRDEATKRDVMSISKTGALVLTVHEAKGMVSESMYRPTLYNFKLESFVALLPSIMRL